MRTLSVILSLALCFSIGAAALEAGQGRANPREEARKAIRQATYTSIKAFLTGDIQGFKSSVTDETLHLLRFAFDIVREDPTNREQLAKEGVTNGEEFLVFFVRRIGFVLSQQNPLSPDEAARVNSEAPIEFKSDTEAVVSGRLKARAVLVGRKWRIDFTDSLKRLLSENVSSRDLRERIRNFKN